MEPGELCSCGDPMIVRRRTLLGLYATCLHCDGDCWAGQRCARCVALLRAEVAP